MKSKYNLLSPFGRADTSRTVSAAVIVVSTIAALTAASPCALGAPNITGANGAITDGSQITITGTGFGASGPNVVIFDDFEKGANGAAISTTPGSAAVNQWWEVESEDAPRYSNSYAHSGSLSNLQAWDESPNAETTFQSRADFGTHVTEGNGVYFSYWIYVPAGGHIPGAASDIPNWKIWTVYGRPFASDHSSPYVQTVGYDELPTGYFLCPDPWYDDAGRQFMDDDWGLYDPGYCPLGMNKGQWHRMEAYLLAGSAANGALGTWELNATLPRRQLGYQTGLTTVHAGDYWDTIGMPAYGRGGQHSNPLTKTYYDDIYVATGPAARARVEIGNAATYNASTNMTVLTPASWSASAITATVRQGSFVDGEQAYLYVTDAAGSVNTNGFPVTVAAAQPDTVAPAPPAGLSVN